VQFYRARSVDEALDQLAKFGSEARVLAGGTDLMPQYLHGEIPDGIFVHIESLEQLATISPNDRTTVGPLVTHRVIATDSTLEVSHPALTAASRKIGGWQTQTVGTIGGNICNASPAADTAAPLLVSDTHLTLSSCRGQRRVPMTDFFLDRRRTLMEPDELLTAIDLEPLPACTGEVYVKLARRGAMEVAIAGIAVRLGFAENGTVVSARVALSSVAPTPRRVAGAETALLGSNLDAAALDLAGEALRDAASPIDDARASASYRLRTLRGLLERATGRCREAVPS